MWAFSSDRLTVYSIQPGRGYEQAAAILGPDFNGILVRDGYAVYRQQLRPATAVLQQLLHLPKPKALELIPTTPR